MKPKNSIQKTEKNKIATRNNKILPGLPGPSGEPPIPVVDVHTHVFNCKDLPLAGILNALGAPLGISNILAKVVTSVTPQNDIDGPIPDLSNFSEELDKIGPLLLKNVQSNQGEPELNSIFSILGNDEKDELLEFVGLSEDVGLDELVLKKSLEREVEILSLAFSIIGFPPGDAEAVPVNIDGHKSVIGDYLGFLSVITKGNLYIATLLSKIEYPEVSFFLHHMMDMAKSYNDKPNVSFDEQMHRMTKLDRRIEFEGKFLHFVAFDPFRGSDSLTSVIRGINAGAIGVKFYPPSGYRASKNVIPSKPSILKPGSRKRWYSRYAEMTGSELDMVNDKLFSYCEMNDIPIFTHCTPKGFQADNDYGKMSDPTYWEPVLKKHNKLRLCFGHSGGHAYWFPSVKPKKDEKEAAEFGRRVVDLCMAYPNVYCEVGYLEEILKPNGRELFKKTLSTIINNTSTKGTWKFGDKIMYGSDWHMIHKESAHRNYPAAFNQIFVDSILKPWQRAFFCRNALAYLQFSKLLTVSGITETQKKYWKELIDGANAGPKSGSADK